jgi:putative restriction endonuclease
LLPLAIKVKSLRLHLVTFSDQGEVIASPRLSDAARRTLKIDQAPPLELVDEQRSRLDWHRKRIWIAD